MTKAEKTRQFIIEKAAPILNQKGMAGTSISDIMAATNLAKGGIYGNFENKEEICLEVFDFLAQRLLKGINNTIQDKLTAKEKLFAYLDFYVDKLLFSEGGCPIMNFGTESDDTNPAIQKRVGQEIRISQDNISKLVTAGIENGEFHEHADATAFAVKMYTILEGAILVGRVLKDNSQMKAIVTMLKDEIEAFSK